MSEIATTPSRPMRALQLRLPRRLLGAAAGWAAPALLILIWQASASLGWLSDSVLPSPAAVLAAGWRLTLSGELPANVGVSFLRAMAGLVVGGSIGFAFGLSNGLSAGARG